MLSLVSVTAARRHGTAAMRRRATPYHHAVGLLPDISVLRAVLHIYDAAARRYLFYLIAPTNTDIFAA